MSKRISNNKKQIVCDIFNALVSINVFEYSEMKDGKNIDYRYNNEKTLNTIMKKCSSLCLQDYSYDIIRDETYCSALESMFKLATEYTEDELILIYKDIHNKTLSITNKFLSRVYKLSVFRVKDNLSGYRKSKEGMVYPDMIEYTDDNINGFTLLEDTESVDIVYFLQWFNSNKENFLTKKQLEFLQDESVAVKGNASHYRRRIHEATLKAYKAEFDSDNDRINEIKNKITKIETILDAPNFVQTFKKYQDKQFIIDIITTHVNMKDMQQFNRGNHSSQVIKAYRVALFKGLSELNDLLDMAIEK